MEQQDKDPQTERLREERYAYYRRCQQFMKNGEQCRCPAEKGQLVCRNHRQQCEAIWRQEEQRFRVLSRVAEARGLRTPMATLADARSVQMAIREVGQQITRGTMERKVAGRLLLELQGACGLLTQKRRL